MNQIKSGGSLDETRILNLSVEDMWNESTRLMITASQHVLKNTSSLVNNRSSFNNAAIGVDYIGYSENSTLPMHNAAHAYHYWSFFLFLFPLFTIFGNILVVLSVFKEKNLQTCTNYFVVSLAISDLIVAAAVMPLAVYYEVTLLSK